MKPAKNKITHLSNQNKDIYTPSLYCCIFEDFEDFKNNIKQNSLLHTPHGIFFVKDIVGITEGSRNEQVPTILCNLYDVTNNKSTTAAVYVFSPYNEDINDKQEHYGRVHLAESLNFLSRGNILEIIN